MPILPRAAAALEPVLKKGSKKKYGVHAEENVVSRNASSEEMS